MLPAAVAVLEGLLCEKDDEAMLVEGCAEDIHREEIVLYTFSCFSEVAGNLVLIDCDLLVLGLNGNSQPQELVFGLVEDFIDLVVDLPVVVIGELLVVRGQSAVKRCACLVQVNPCFEVLFPQDEKFLLHPQREGNRSSVLLTNQMQQP